MRGQRIIDRLTSGSAAEGNQGLTKRELKKRVSVQYRNNFFEEDFAYLLSSNVIAQQRVGRELRTVVTCPGVHNDNLDIEAHTGNQQAEPLPFSPNVGDRVLISYQPGSPWNVIGVVIYARDEYSGYYTVIPESGDYKGTRGGFSRRELKPVPVETVPSISESLQAELEPIKTETEPVVPKIGDRVRVTYGFGWNGDGVIDYVSPHGSYGIVLKTGEHAGSRGGFYRADFELITESTEMAGLSEEIRSLEQPKPRTGCGGLTYYEN